MLVCGRGRCPPAAESCEIVTGDLSSPLEDEARRFIDFFALAGEDKATSATKSAHRRRNAPRIVFARAVFNVANEIEARPA